MTAEDRAKHKADVQELLDNDELLKPDPTKPSAGLTLGLIALPIVLILIKSVCDLALPEGNVLRTAFTFLGDNNIALFIAMMVTGIALHKYLVPASSPTLWNYIDKVSDSVGNITVNDAFVATTLPTTLASLVGFVVVVILNMFSGVLPGMF